MKTKLKAKGLYDFRKVVFSHGWIDLAPFYLEDTRPVIQVGIRTQNGPRAVGVSGTSNGLVIESKGPPLSKETINAVQYMFRLDDDLNDFYAHARTYKKPWIANGRMGRLLRSQSVFEDLVKMILTTNCSWALTRYMTDTLANTLGEPTDSGLRLFPTPEALASKPESFFRKKIHAGYRSSYLSQIGKQICSGKLDPESWRNPKRNTEDVRKEILKVPGAGPYVADNMLKLLGRYDYLGLDSWARGKLKELWKMKKIPSDKTIERRYKVHEEFKGLVLLCDLTRDWFESNEFKSWIRSR